MFTKMGRFFLTIVVTALLVFGGLLIFTDAPETATASSYTYSNGVAQDYNSQELPHNCVNVPHHAHSY